MIWDEMKVNHFPDFTLLRFLKIEFDLGSCTEGQQSRTKSFQVEGIESFH